MNLITKRITIIALLLALAAMTEAFAQQPVLTDDLNTGMDKIMDRYKPADSLDPVQFNKRIDKIRKDAYRQIKSGGSKETTLRRLDVDYYLRGVLSTYRVFHGFGASKKTNLLQLKYIDSLIYSNTDLNNEELYKRSQAYREWVDNYLRKIYKIKYKEDTALQYLTLALPISVIEGEIQDPFIRDAECYSDASLILKLTKDSALAKKIYQDFNAAVTNTHFRENMQQVYDNYRRLHTVGWPAPEFTYTDVSGKQITLASLRGKYVYIDIWATWCVPCKGQIPFLMKMEEKYKGKNIQFVSLSVDKQADAGAWRKYVTENKLTGYQVMADKDFNSDFIKKFNIASIPRFILIDSAGKVLDGDAKKPSDPALKKQVDQLLGIPVTPFTLSLYARQTDFSGHWQLDTCKSKFGHPEMFISSALNVTKNDSALMIEGIYANKAIKESHYSQQFKLDGTAAHTTTGNGWPEADSIEDKPDIPALTLDINIELFPNYTAYYTEAWTLEDGGKTLVVDRQQALPGFGPGDEIKIYYNKK